jgi:gamma-tubulin complex component 3
VLLEGELCKPAFNL